MPNLAKIFGANVRLYRKSLKLTQDDLSSLTGFDQGHLARIERGEINVSLDTIDKLSLFFKVPASDLLRSNEKITDESKKNVLDKINILLLNRSVDELNIVQRIIKEIFLLKGT